MRRRLGHLALVLFQAFWLNIVLPGHTRGVVTLPGSSVSAEDASCCGGSDDDPNPSSQDRVHCAVCYFAAMLMTPPLVSFALPPLDGTAQSVAASAAGGR